MNQIVVKYSNVSDTETYDRTLDGFNGLNDLLMKFFRDNLLLNYKKVITKDETVIVFDFVNEDAKNLYLQESTNWTKSNNEYNKIHQILKV